MLDVLSFRAKYRYIDTSDPSNSEIVKSKSLPPDPYVIFDTVSNKHYASQINFSQEGEKSKPGTDYGLVYRITNPHLPDFKWLVFSGISRADTLACFEAMVNPNTLSQIREQIDDDDADVEILFETLIINGRGIGSTPLDVNVL